MQYISNAARLVVVTLAAGVVSTAGSQSIPADELTLDSFIAEVIATNPQLAAAGLRVGSAEAAAGAAGHRPDARLSLGAVSMPVSSLSFGEPMSQKVIGITQRLPYPGKLSLQREAATELVGAAVASEKTARFALVRSARLAWYDLALVDALIEITIRKRAVLTGVVEAAEAGQAAGRVGQESVLRARVELSRAADQASMYFAQRLATVATMNTMRNQTPGTVIGRVNLPSELIRVAIADSASPRFDGDSLGALVETASLPTIDSLVFLANQHNPMIQSHVARIAGQNARYNLAKKAAFPDLDLTLQYGQRNDHPDLITARVEFPLPLRKGRIQNQIAAAAESELHAEHAEHDQMLLGLTSKIASLWADAIAARTRAIIFTTAILPQGRAALAAALNGLRVGTTSFISVLEAEQSLFSDETTLAKTLAHFATTIAELDEVVGMEVLQ